MGQSPNPLSHHEIKLNRHCVRNAVKMGHSPKPHILHELVERKNMEHINQQLQKIITLTPYHLGELIETIEQIEAEMRNNEAHKNMTQHQDIIKHLEQIKAQANICKQ